MKTIPESFMKLLGYARAYFGLPYRKPKEWYRHILPSVFPRYQTTAPSTVESIN